MSTELVDSNGPLTSTDRVYGRINGTPKSYSPDLLYDFIKTRTDTLYPTQSAFSSLDDYVSAFTLQKSSGNNNIWDGQGLRATGFAAGVDDDDLATVGQITALPSAVTIGTTVINGGTSGSVLFINGGVAGEYEVSGTGKVLMDTNPVVTLALTLGTQQTTRGSLVLANTAAGAFPVTLQSSNSTSAAWSLTLPTTAGSNGQALTTNGSGVTTWTSIVTSPGGSDGQFQYNNSSAFGGANLYVESANLIAQRNSTTAQGKRVYNSYTDGSNGEWLSLDWTTTSNTASILTAKNGSGTQRALELGASGAANWRITTSGHLLAVTDNTYDIGATGATRPRNLYVAGTGIFGGLLTTIATALGGAGFNLPHGTAPSSPNNGDVWTTTAGIYARVNGATVGPLGAVVTAAGSNTQVQFNNSGSFGASANLTWSSPTLTIGVAASVTGALSLANATSGSAILTADAANTLALRNGTSAQTFNVYNTYTDASNYEALSVSWIGNTCFLYVPKAGTGSSRDLKIRGGGSLFLGSNNAEKWQIDATGHFLAQTDNTYDIGASGATRPRNVYVGTIVFMGTASMSTTGFRSVKGALLAPSGNTDGWLRLTDSAETSFGALQFGGGTSSFPALKRDGVGLRSRLADDSADTWHKVLRTVVGSLPSASTSGAGAFAIVTDATAPTIGSTVTGGGAIQCFVISDGSNWLAA